MGFQDPIVGGIALRIPAIRSPNFVAGSQGWTINIDGSAEFNNLTVRGTFFGTDYVINAAGAFFYSGTPAAGNLVVSIASNPGVDSFGNAYPSGINTQSGSVNGDQFLNISQGNIFLGAIASGSQDLLDAAEIFPSPTLAQLALRSGKTLTLPDPALLHLVAGSDGQTTGAATPQIQIRDQDADSDVDLHISGSVIKTNQTGTAYGWQTPSYNSGWASGDVAGSFQPLQYRLDGLDNIYFTGAMHTTSATPAANAFSVAAPYIPKKSHKAVAFQISAGTVMVGYCQLDKFGAFQFNPPITSANVDVYFYGKFPLGNIS